VARAARDAPALPRSRGRDAEGDGNGDSLGANCPKVVADPSEFDPSPRSNFVAKEVTKVVVRDEPGVRRASGRRAFASFGTYREGGFIVPAVQ